MIYSGTELKLYVEYWKHHFDPQITRPRWEHSLKDLTERYAPHIKGGVLEVLRGKKLGHKVNTTCIDCGVPTTVQFYSRATYMRHLERSYVRCAECTKPAKPEAQPAEPVSAPVYDPVSIMTREQRRDLRTIIRIWREEFNLPLPASRTLCTWVWRHDLAVIEAALGMAGYWWVRTSFKPTPDEIADYASEYALIATMHIDKLATLLDQELADERAQHEQDVRGS